MKDSAGWRFARECVAGLVCLLMARGLCAWDWQPHQFATASAWGALPEKERALLDAEQANRLSRTYSLLPDLWRESAKREPWMDRFVTSPKGVPIHGGLLALLRKGQEQDYLETERWLLEQLAAAIRSRNAEEAARWAGVIAHDVEDTFAVGHAMGVGIAPALADLYKRVVTRYQTMGFDMSKPGTLRLIHFDSLPDMEKSWPGIAGYEPRVLGKDLDEAARNILADWAPGIRGSAAAFERILPMFIKPGTEEIREWKDLPPAEQAEANRILCDRAAAAAKLVADIYHTAFALAASTATVPPASSPATEALTFGNRRFSLSLDPNTGVWRTLRWNGETIAETKSIGYASVDIQTARDKWLSLTDPAVVRPASHTWDAQSSTLRLLRRMGEWELEEQVEFGAEGNPDRIGRSVRLTYRPQAQGAEAVKFYRVRFVLSLPKQGAFLSPSRDPFDERRSGDIAKLPKGFWGGGVWGVSPLLIEQAPNRTLLFINDARRDPADTTFWTNEDSTVCVAHNFSAQGWAEPNVTQTVGVAYMDVVPAALEEALKTAIWRWFDDVGIKTPANRPDWVRKAALYSFHPGGTIGSNCLDLGGFKAAREQLLPHVARLGFGAVWMLPLEDRSIYNPRDYYRFQEGLGTSAEYRDLVKATHRLGLNVWQDIVPHGGTPPFGHDRGNKPWWLVFDEKGDALSYWCFDFREPEWQRYVAQVAEHYVREYDIDGYRIDAVGGSHMMNWRRAGFPPADKTPANVPEDWWRASLAEVGGNVPALPYERGSLTLREGGLQMMRGIREAVKKLKPEAGAILGEVQSPPYMQEADVLYDFTLAHRMLLEIRRFAPERFVPALQRWLEEQKYAEPRGTVRMRYVESHDTIRSQGWYGVSAVRALMALTMWIQGMPMLYHEAEVGHGPFVQKILALRAALPELQTGDACYEAVKSEPHGVFTCLRTLDRNVSIVAINLTPEACDAVLTVPVERLLPDRSVVWDAMNGRKVAEGSPGELRRISLHLDAWAPTVLSLRPVSAPAPVAVEEPQPTVRPPSGAPSPPELRLRGHLAEVQTGRYRLVVNRRTGFLESFCDADGNRLLNPCELALSMPVERGECVSADRQTTEAVELRSRLKLQGERGATLTYRCLPIHVEIEAALDEALQVGRAGLLFAGVEAYRYRVNTVEGLLDDWFVPRHLLAKQGTHHIYYRPQGTEIVWQAETNPLHPEGAFLRAFRRDGRGVELRVLNPLDAGPANALLLDRLGDQVGWHAGFLWRDSVSMVSQMKRTDRFALRLTALPTAEPIPSGPKQEAVSVGHTSLDWTIENAHYRIRLRRTGGVIRSMWLKRPALRLIAEDNDIYTDQGFRTDRERYAGARYDIESGVRVWRDGKALRMRFQGLLRGEDRFGILNPPIRFSLEYGFDDSPTVAVHWSVLSEASVREPSAFLAWVVNVPDAQQFILQRSGKDLVCGRLDPSRRVGETAKLPGGPTPDGAVLMGGDGRPLLQLTDLRLRAPAPLSNAFVHGSRVYLAWLDGPGQKITPGRWYDAGMSITLGEASPVAAPAIAWMDESALAPESLPDPSFEGGGSDVFLLSQRRTIKMGEAVEEAWDLPRGVTITDETAHTGRKCAKIVNTTGSYLLLTHPVRIEEFPAGCKVRLSAWVKGDKITRGDPSWKTGIVGLSYQQADGKWIHPSVEALEGTFDWRKVEGVIEIPPDATGLMLRLGLNGATGTMWIDDVRMDRVK